MTLGQKLKQLRLENKMTLQDMAEGTGYSKAFISRIENSSVSPSVSSLIRIAAVFHIGLHELFAAVEGSRISIVKKNSRKSYTGSGSRIRIDSLCLNPVLSKMDALIKTFEAGAVIEEKKKGGGGEEWWYVLRGKLEVSFGDETTELSEGDSIYLISETSRKWRNPGRGKTSALVVMTPPAAPST